MIIHWFWSTPAWFWWVFSWFWWALAWLSFSCSITYKSFLVEKVQSTTKYFEKNKKIKQSQRKRKKKKWYLLLRTFWAVVLKIYFSRGDRAKDWVPMISFHFPDIYLLCKILSLKSFSRAWAKSYIQFVLLDIKFYMVLRFTCRE